MYLTVAETKGPCNMTMNWPENAMPRIFYFILKAVRGNDIMRLHFTINFQTAVQMGKKDQAATITTQVSKETKVKKHEIFKNNSTYQQ